MLYYQKDFTSESEVNYGVGFKCPFCGTENFYRGKFKTKVTETAPYGFKEDSAPSRARYRADRDLRNSVNGTADALREHRFMDTFLRDKGIICKHCHKTQPWADYPRDEDGVSHVKVIIAVLAAWLPIWIIINIVIPFMRYSMYIAPMLSLVLSVCGAMVYIKRKAKENRKKREEADRIMGSADFETPVLYIKTDSSDSR